jgi:hypothetical protein
VRDGATGHQGLRREHERDDAGCDDPVGPEVIAGGHDDEHA